MAFCPFMSDSSKTVNCKASCALYKKGKCSLKTIAETNEARLNAEGSIANILNYIQTTSSTK